MSPDPTMRTALLAAGLRILAFPFSGSGDSGDLEAVQLPPDPSAAVDFETSNLDAWDNDGTPAQRELLKRYYEDLDALAMELLDQWPVDWYNNNGGAGVLGVDLLTGKAYVQGGWYTQERQDYPMALQFDAAPASTFQDELTARLFPPDDEDPDE